jgi:hypothetical protein
LRIFERATGHEALKFDKIHAYALAFSIESRWLAAYGWNALQPKSAVKDLEDTRYAVRQTASQKLEQCGDAAELALREALRKNPTLESRRRLEILLDKVTSFPPPRAQLTAIRAVAALEWIGNAEARELLASLAKGAPGARLTQEAQSALGRLSRRAVEDR